MTLTWNRVLLLIAVVLFLLATLVAGGIVSGSLGWAVPGGLTAFALAFLLPLGGEAAATRVISGCRWHRHAGRRVYRNFGVR
jgi:hypothetical protein